MIILQKNTSSVGRRFNVCIQRRTCQNRGKNCNIKNCTEYKKELCPKLNKPPYVCNGLPIAMNIYLGNETKHLIPLQEKMEKDFELNNKKTIICTDVAMCTDETKQFNIKEGKVFVITQSIKK